MKNWLFLSLALLMTIAPITHAIVIRHDRADERYLGLGGKYPAVGRVGRRMGDGTLIGDRWVLTAAHVARGLMRRSLEPSVFFGERAYRVSQAYPHPEWVDMGPHDIAVLELAETVKDITPLALYSRKDEKGQIAVMVGHGRTGTGDNRERRDDDKKRGATNRIEEANDRHLVFRFDAPPDGTDLEGIPSGGDSGGPALLTVNGVSLVAGVSSAGQPGPGGPGTYGALDYFTRVSTHADWVRRVLERKVAPTDFKKDAAVVSRAQGGAPSAIPDSPAGKRMKALTELLFRADETKIEAFLREHVSTQRAPSRSPEETVAVYRRLMQEFRGGRVAQVMRNHRLRKR